MGLAILLGLGLRLAFMAASVENAPVTSDEAMMVLQAKSIAGGARPIFFPAQPYQFPLGAYLSAPLVEHLPRNALGARWLGFLLELAALGLLLHAARRLAGWERWWPAGLLLIFPSAYWLTFQAGYAVPSYDMMLPLWALTLWAALAQRRRGGWAGAVGAAGCGLVAGLAFSVHPLSLSLVIPLALFVCLDRDWRSARVKTPAFALGLLLGLLPFLLGDLIHPGASANVSNRRPLMHALNLDFAEVTAHALSGVWGFFACAFPDGGEEIHAWPGLATPLLCLSLLILLAATMLSARDILTRARRERWLRLEPGDIFPWACWLGLGLFALSELSNSGQFRYLLVMAWCQPFLAARIFSGAKGWWRKALGLALAGLLLFNLAAALAMVDRWRRPGYVAGQSQCQDLAPAIAVLEREGIKFCYAAHWTAARITFLTDERIICSQPFNQRFRGWPLPYIEAVNKAERAAYVLTVPDSFSATDFEQVLEKNRVGWREIKAGIYHVYLNFRQASDAEGELVPPDALRVSASHQPEAALGLAQGRGWNSGQGQQAGMWVEIELGRPLAVNRLLLRYPDENPDSLPGSYRLLARENGAWREIVADAPGRLDGFELVKQNLVWDRPVQNLRFDLATTDALRLEVSRAGKDTPWRLAGVEVFRRAGPE